VELECGHRPVVSAVKAFLMIKGYGRATDRSSEPIRFHIFGTEPDDLGVSLLETMLALAVTLVGVLALLC
jgi:hypothetical protein